jgi:hypothetical protein
MIVSIGFTAQDDNSTDITAGSTGYANTVVNQRSGPWDFSGAMGYKLLGAPAAENPGQFSAAGFNAGASWAAATFALRRR